MKRWTLPLLAALLAAPPLAAQEALVFPLALKSASGFGDTAEFTSKQRIPQCPVAWSVRIEELHGGRQEGTQLITIDNGKLEIVLIPSRGMGIFHVYYDAGRDKNGKNLRRRLGWRSPVEDVVNPVFMNLTARGGLGWLEGFNEFQCRCGLENVGQPGKDEIVTNTGAKTEVDLTLHGKIATIPARDLFVVIEQKPPYRIAVRAVVRERMLFGPNLELQTELSTDPGSMLFRIVDKVVNKGATPQEFQVLYHTNFGKPLLSEGARFLAPVKQVTPFNAHAAKDVKRYGDVAGPKAGAIEQVYLMHPLAGKDGRTLALVHAKDQAHGMSMRWSVKELPYLTLWKNTAAVQDGYVIGVEPGTSFPNMRKVERAAGRVPKLDAGKSHTMTLDFAVHPDTKSVQAAAAEIDAIQRTQQPMIDEFPQKQKE